jgi:parallel beta-helix repeat protein
MKLRQIVLAVAFLVAARVSVSWSQTTTSGITITDQQCQGGQTLTGGKCSVLKVTPPGSPPPSCQGVAIAPSQDINSVMAAQPAGAIGCLSAGVWRVSTAIGLQDSQQLFGVAGQTIITGAKALTGWAAFGSNFVATGFLPSTPGTFGRCSRAGCSYAQDVYFDGAPFQRVLRLSALGPGKFYENFSTNKIYIRDDPTGHTVEQNYASAVFSSTNTGIGLSNLIVQGAANDAQSGAIQCNGSSGWNMTGIEVRYSHGTGIECDAYALTNSHVHHMGQLGVSCHVYAIMTGNEIDYNNTAGYEQAWEAGGVKCVRTTGKVISRAVNNNVHDNAGAGLWCDINCYDWVYDSNTVVRNTGYGIIYEISDKCQIINNTVTGNGPSVPRRFYTGGDIVISASPNCKVAGNNLTAILAVGMGVLQQSRNDSCQDALGNANYPDGTPVCPGGIHRAANEAFSNNTASTTNPGALVAGVWTNCCDTIYSLSGITFTGDTYTLPNQTGTFFTWKNNDLTLTEWQAIPQQ